MDWISSHRAEPQPQRGEQSRQRDENAYIREQICARVCVVPCVRPRGACLQNSFFRRFTIYVCVYILRKERSLFDTRVRIYLHVLCSNTREQKGGKCDALRWKKSFQKLPLITKSNSAERERERRVPWARRKEMRFWMR